MTTILIIEDYQEITALLEVIFAEDSSIVTASSTRQDALRLLRWHPFDVVITNIPLHEFDSFELIWEINAMQLRPRVIALTDCTSLGSREYLAEMAETLSVRHLLYKPFTIDELLESVSPPEGVSVCAGAA